MITLASGTIAGDPTGRARINPEESESASVVSGRARLVADSSGSPTVVSGRARLDSKSPESPNVASGRAKLASVASESPNDVSGRAPFSSASSHSPGSPNVASGRARLVNDSAGTPASASDGSQLPQVQWSRAKTRVTAAPVTAPRQLAPTELPPENLFPPQKSTEAPVAEMAAEVVFGSGPVAEVVPGRVSSSPSTSARRLPQTQAPADNLLRTAPISGSFPVSPAPGAVAASESPAVEAAVSDVAANRAVIKEPQFTDVAPYDTREPAAAFSMNAAEPAGDQISAGSNDPEGIQETFETAHHRRMEHLMTGREPGPVSSVGEWWHGHSEQYVANNRHLVVAVAQSPRLAQAAVQSSIVDHTLPENPVPEVDFYDSNPIARSSPSTQPEIPDLPPEDVGEMRGTSRLKTDIRTIKPTLSYALKGIDRDQLPDDFDQKIDSGEYVARQTSPTVLQWAPTNLWHYPLYFEDPALERYGHTYHPFIQPFASTGRFATQLVGLPYQMTLHPVCSREYALGYYRPGECAPKKFYQIPFNEEATLMEVATLAGLILIFP